MVAFILLLIRAFTSLVVSKFLSRYMYYKPIEHASGMLLRRIIAHSFRF